MKKKVKTCFSRFLCVFLCLVFFFAFCIFPASASNVSSNDSFLDLMEYQELPLESFTRIDFGTVCSFYNLVNPFPKLYDSAFLDVYSYKPISSIYADGFGFNYSIIDIGNGFYRIICTDMNMDDIFDLQFRFSSYNTYFSIVSFNVFPSNSHFSVPALIYYNNAGRSSLDSDGYVPTFQGNFDGSSIFYFNGTGNDPLSRYFDFDITTYVSPADWHGYDSLNYCFVFYSQSITSIAARIGNFVLPIETSFIDNTGYVTDVGTGSVDNVVFYPDGSTFVQVRIDLSGLDRSSGEYICLQVSGSYNDNVGDYFGYLFSIGGQVIPDSIDTDVVWYRRLYYLIKNIFEGDGSADQALQTQEQVNTQVNNEIVAAVNDWNTQITVVQTGYDDALSKVTPGLSWLANLADGVFNGMSWFGNVYFLVGLVSVFMLILSKSGLAHKIGNVYKKGDS